MGSEKSLEHREPCSFSFETDHDISFMKVSPNQKLLLVGYGSSNIRLYNLETNTFLSDFEGCTYSKGSGNTATADFSPDSKLIAYRWDKCVRLFDTEQMQMVREINVNETSITISFSPDGQFLLVGCRCDLLKLVNLNLDSSVSCIWEIKARI